MSRCVQQFSYSYALVRDSAASTMPPAHASRRVRHEHFPRLQAPHPPHVPQAPPDDPGWSLDYIRVRAGCSCEIRPPRKKRPERHKYKRVKHRKTLTENDET